MSKDYGQGIFSMPLITSVSKTRDLTLAKNIVLAAIDADEHALPASKEKAKAMVLGSRTVDRLAIGMMDFSLSHQGLKVIR